jgi:crotonobetainyl-CoA:carnitine CoA-transferase CaiB-like acyl-CoA transferase
MLNSMTFRSSPMLPGDPHDWYRHPALAIAPSNVHPSKDGHVAIFTASERRWHSIARVLRREDLLENPDCASTPARAARMDEIDEMVEAWTRGRGKNDVVQELTRARVPCAPVRDGGQGRQ